MYTLHYLQNEANQCMTEVEKGKWVPARPIPPQKISLRARFWEAWMVFTAKADAFVWPEDDPDA